MDSQYDTCTENFFHASLKLEEKEKLFDNAEADEGSLSRRVRLLEDEVERSDERLAKVGVLPASHKISDSKPRIC
jgi:hypothetical protein